MEQSNLLMMEREESISVLCSILAKKGSLQRVKAVRSKLEHLEGLLKFRIGGFACGNEATVQQKCECWFENEYFEYVDTDSANIHHHVRDEKLLNKICDRIRAGQCEHVTDNVEVLDEATTEHPTEESGTVHQERCFTFISYIHAAAAVGNISVVKYLSNSRSACLGFRTSTGLIPLHVAVCKQQSHIVKYLKTKYMINKKRRFSFCHRKLKPLPIPDEININTFWNNGQEILQPIRISKRSKLAGHVKEVELSLYTLKSPLIALLRAVDHPKLDLIRACVDLLEVTQLRDFIIYCLVQGEENVAICVYNAIANDGITLAIKVVSVLTDSDRFLRRLNQAGENITFPALNYELNDLAEAVGSFRCYDLLTNQLGFQKNKGASPFMVFFTFGLKIGLHAGKELLLKCLNHLKMKGYCVYLNMKNSDGITPLHFILSCSIHKNSVHSSIRSFFVRTLLELGADVDLCDRQNRTALFQWVTQSMNYGGRDFISNIANILLYFNPSPAVNPNLPFYCHTSDKKVYQSKQILDGSEENKDTGDSLKLTYSKSLFAVMHELGFVMDKSSAHEIDAEIKQMWPVFYREVYTQPRSLKSYCRLVIRRSYQRSKVIRLLEELVLPSSIKRYILAEDILAYSDIV